MTFNYTNKDYARIHDKGTIFNKFLKEATQLAERVARNRDKKIETDDDLQSAVNKLTREVDRRLNPREYYWFQRAIYWTGLRDLQNPKVGMLPRYVAGILFDDELYRHCAILLEFLLFDLEGNLFGGPHDLQGMLKYKDIRLNILLQDRLFVLEEFVLQLIVDSQSTAITYPESEYECKANLEAQEYLIKWYKERQAEILLREGYKPLKDIPEPLPQGLIVSLAPPPKPEPKAPTVTIPIKVSDDSFGNMNIKKASPSGWTNLEIAHQSIPALLTRLANEIIGLKQEVRKNNESIIDAQTGEVDLLVEIRELLRDPTKNPNPTISAKATQEQGLEDEVLGTYDDVANTALRHVSQWPDLASVDLSEIEPKVKSLHGIFS